VSGAAGWQDYSPQGEGDWQDYDAKPKLEPPGVPKPPNPILSASGHEDLIGDPGTGFVARTGNRIAQNLWHGPAQTLEAIPGVVSHAIETRGAAQPEGIPLAGLPAAAWHGVKNLVGQYKDPANLAGDVASLAISEPDIGMPKNADYPAASAPRAASSIPKAGTINDLATVIHPDLARRLVSLREGNLAEAAFPHAAKRVAAGKRLLGMEPPPAAAEPAAPPVAPRAAAPPDVPAEIRQGWALRQGGRPAPPEPSAGLRELPAAPTELPAAFQPRPAPYQAPVGTVENPAPVTEVEPPEPEAAPAPENTTAAARTSPSSAAAAPATAAPPVETSPGKLGELLTEGLGGKKLVPGVPLRNQPAAMGAKLPEGFTPVESSALKGYKYDPATQEFDAITNSGQRLRHSEVTPEQFKTFEQADSKGKAWNELRKGPGVTPRGKVDIEGKLQPRIKPRSMQSATPEDLTNEWQAELDRRIQAGKGNPTSVTAGTPERSNLGVERRADIATRQKVAEMSPDELRKTLLTSEKTGLPNRRAFDEAGPSPAVGMSDADGLKALNDKFGYEGGDALLKAKAQALQDAGLDAYHDKGDEFLYRAGSAEELQTKLEQARQALKEASITVRTPDGKVKTFKGADFSYGVGEGTNEAEQGLKTHKAQREARGERARGELRGITEQ